MERLQPLIGRWKVTVDAPWAGDVPAWTSFEPVLGGRFVVQRSEVDVEVAPDALSIIAPAADGDGFIQHYFDSRGVVRLYAMTFADGVWRLERSAPDFTPLTFSQRFEGRLSGDGDRIDGRWEKTGEAGDFELDFELTYTREG